MNVCISPKIELDPDRHFRTDHLRASLGQRSVRATGVTVLNQAIVLVLRIAGGIVLARLLAPEDYGLMSMATVVLGVLALFNDMGLSAATMQKPVVTHSEASTTFWVTVGISSLLAVLVIALAPAAAWFFGERRVVAVLMALAISPIMTGLSFPQSAVIKRQMRYGTVAVIEFISAVASLGGAIAWACVRPDYWALVVMHLLCGFLGCCGFWLASGWRPGWPGPLSIVRTQIHFGTRLTGAQLLSYLTRNMDNVLIGWYWGVEQLGLYARAYQLMLMPMRQVSGPIGLVAMPSLSRLQGETERYRRYLNTSLCVMAYVAMPLTLSVAVLSDDLILVLLGAKWLPASAIFRVLALAALIEPFLSSADWVMGSTGRTDRLLRWGMIQTPLILLSYLIGLPFGGLGVATAYVCCSYLLVVPCLLYAMKESPARASEVFGALWRPACISAVMGLAMVGTHMSVAGWTGLWVIIACSGVGLSVFALILGLWPRARADAATLVKVTQMLLARKPGANLASSPVG